MLVMPGLWPELRPGLASRELLMLMNRGLWPELAQSLPAGSC